MDLDPKEILKELVSAVLEWEDADAQRTRILDSKRATPDEVRAANTRLVASIRKLRTVAKKVRKLMNGKTLKKKGSSFNWLAALKVTAKALNAVVDVSERNPTHVSDRRYPTHVIDTTAEVLK